MESIERKELKGVDLRGWHLYAYSHLDDHVPVTRGTSRGYYDMLA